MNGYDLHKARYEAMALTVVEAERRSRLISLNWDPLPQQPAQMIPPAMQHTPINYPPYVRGYPDNATRMALPPHIADPAPVVDQFQHTSWHPYHMFDATDLPALLFRLEPSADIHSGIPVPVLIDAQTQLPVLNFENKALRYFSFLPRHIASSISGALLEFWFRLDYRLEMNDIRHRISPDDTGMRPSLNALSMKRTRWREGFSALAWKDCRTWPVRGDLERVGRLSMLQISFNTTMIVDWPNRRLLKPVFDNIACKSQHVIGYANAGLPLNVFLSDVVTTIPTRRMYGILTLRWRLQQLAWLVGHGDSPENYLHLSNDLQPRWWNDRRPRAGGRRAPERVILELADQFTHGEYMENEIGDDQEIGAPRSQQNRGQ